MSGKAIWRRGEEKYEGKSSFFIIILIETHPDNFFSFGSTSCFIQSLSIMHVESKINGSIKGKMDGSIDISIEFKKDGSINESPLKGIDFIVSSGKHLLDPSFLPFLFLTSMASTCLQLWVAAFFSRNLMAEDYQRACDGTCMLFIGLDMNE